MNFPPNTKYAYYEEDTTGYPVVCGTQEEAERIAESRLCDSHRRVCTTIYAMVPVSHVLKTVTTHIRVVPVIPHEEAVS